MEYNITKDNGEIVSAGYLRRRVMARLGRFKRHYSLVERQATINRTIENPDWMKVRFGYTVGAIAAAVICDLIENGTWKETV